MRVTKLPALCCLWAQLAFVVTGCGTPAARAVVAKPAVAAPAAIAAPPPETGRARVAIDKTAVEGVVTLGLPVPDKRAALAVEPLAARETTALLGRLEPMPDLSAAPAPIVRAPTAPPARSGSVQPIAFIAPQGRPVSAAPLPPVVERRLLAPPQIEPTGEVPLESEIRIRFDEPMVPVAKVGDAPVPPATIAPAATGLWRWLDTRVLVFTSRQLARSTDFTVTVPAGITAVSGAVLATPVTSTFSTRPIAVAGPFPRAKLRPDSPLVVGFDQDFDADKIAKLVTIRTDKKKLLAFDVIDLATAQRRWEANPAIDGADVVHIPHPLALAPRTAWPAGATLQLELAKGAPSREGPRLSTRESFATYEVAEPFAFEGLTCDDKPARLAGAICPAKNFVMAVFSNPIAASTFRAEKVQIDGEPFEDHEATTSNSIDLTVPNHPGRTFGVSIGDGLVDIYGQPFWGPHHATFVASPQQWEPTVEAHTGMYILDPRYEIPQWQVNAEAIAGLRVELYKVEPKDYFAYAQFEEGKRATPPGKRVYQKDHDVGGAYGAKLRVDLRPALDADKLGHVIALAVPRGARGAQVERRYTAWIQVSKLAASLRFDGQRLSAWVSKTDPARFLEPLAGATVAIERDGKLAPERSGTTDANGHAVLELVEPSEKPPSRLLVFASGADRSFLDIGAAEKSVRRDEARWYVTDDRFLYKPGEPVYLKGWVRWTDTGINPALALPRSGETVAYTLRDSRNNQIAAGTAPLGDQGGFDLQVTLPPTPGLGMAYFTLATRSATYTHPIQIQEFRTPAYSVSLNDDIAHGGALPVVLGESIEMLAEAKYYAGGGLAGAEVDWDARLEPATYRPPGWGPFRFTPPVPRADRWRSYNHHPTASARAHGTLSGASTAGIAVGIPALVPFTPSVLEVDATIADVDRMHIRATSRKIIVHPSAYYVGIRATPDRENTELQAIVTDIDGAPVAGVPIEIAIEGVLGSERYRADASIVDAQHCSLTSGAAPVPCAWKRGDDKLAYTATATIADPRGRTNATLFEIPWFEYEEHAASLSLVPDKAVYKPGDIAKLEIRSAIVPATAIVSFARQGVIAQRQIALVKASTIVELPIETAFIENVVASVDRWSAKPPADKGSKLPFPEHSSVTIDLKVDRESARLAMTARALRSIVGPGDDATYEVTVKHDDKPVANAEVALIVVDEAVLALAGKRHADPLEPFYRHVAAGMSEATTFTEIDDEGETLDEPPGFSRFKLDDFGYGRSGFGAGGGALGGMSNGVIGGVRGMAIASRKDFRANAVFSPHLHTDARGVVRLTVKMPDNLTRFRIIALATAGTYQFGMVENAITTQRKLNARMVPPRFLTQGDQFSLPVVVQNLDDKPRTIDVAVRAANLAGKGPMGKRVTVPGGQRAELRFDFATLARGRAAIQAIALAGELADASNTEIQVYEPATTESFAMYGTVDEAPQFEQLAVPREIFPEVGGVEVEIASTQLQALTDAYWYLYAYPYECAEQRSARMLATAAMDKLLDAFQSPGRPNDKEIAAQRRLDLAKLDATQNADGGWGYFRDMHSDPFVTMQVVSALAADRAASGSIKFGLAFVTRLTDATLASLAKSAKLPAADRKDREQLPYRVALVAAGLATLASAGVDATGRAERLHAAATTLDAYPIDAKARVLALLAQQKRDAAPRAKLLADLLSATHETAAGATVTAAYVPAERLLLPSNAKTTALVLDAIMREEPAQSIIAKLARGLLAAREHGRWHTTQENLAVLQAMRRYFDTYEKATPSYTGKVWFGAAGYAEQAFLGRSNTRGEIALGWPALGIGTSHDLALAKEGTGRMYYRIGITYAPKQVDLPALDAGFVVQRTYTAIDDPHDVVHRADGSWRIALGARVLVRLVATATTRRDNVALVDPLPSGFEIVNSALAVAERPAAGVADWSWDYVNLRDNRAETFAAGLAAGPHEFDYTIRATTPGTFIAAPAKAEEMYAPETFGRSNGATVVIE